MEKAERSDIPDIDKKKLVNFISFNYVAALVIMNIAMNPGLSFV